MFHHFHDDEHPISQGSIDRQTLLSMIDFLNSECKIIDSNLFIKKSLNKTLKGNEICLTFDDALKCQYDVALPVLKEKGISAFFFVYSSAFKDNPDMLEIFRYFRTIKYADIDQFYEEFFNLLKIENNKLFNYHHQIFLKIDYLKHFEFYSENDRFFRYLRDVYLSKNKYYEHMESLMNLNNFNIDKAKKKLWINKKDLVKLHNSGHSIGLHSDTHPTVMSNLSFEEQYNEYYKNKNYLENILDNIKIISMAHPCGNYNNDTLQALEGLDIAIGFRANMSKIKNRTLLEIPREDHANIHKNMINL